MTIPKTIPKTIPNEFTEAVVQANSPREAQLYSDFLRCGEPWKSMYRNNPWLLPPDMGKPLEWGTGRYWDTTVARKHPHWKHYELPVATQDIQRMRRDLREWGFCLIEEGLSRAQCVRFRDRLLAQAEGERRAGVAMPTPSGQYVNSLVNKGRCFVQCIEQDPEGVQAGPLIEQLMDEALGKGWICHSFLSNGADPGGYPQALHLDQAPLLPFQTQQAPVLFNSMYIPQDINEENGGTLLIPGSHKILAEAGSGGEVGELPPAINLEAQAGTLLIFDGRLLHGTGANRTDRQRFVATMSNVTAWTRQQENWIMTVSPEVLAAASPKLLHRMGLQALTYGGTVEGFGLGAQGRVGDAFGSLKEFRQLYDRGAYVRVGELSAESSKEEVEREYSLRAAYARVAAQRKAAS
jgi:ectoine hydroxylase-related dioxygenase (phytanoyl-CoA dioxygenase family)